MHGFDEYIAVEDYLRAIRYDDHVPRQADARQEQHEKPR
jgi:hypothetical protein